MKRVCSSFLLFLALLASVLIAAQPCRAALGGTADSVESDRAALSAVHAATTVRNFYTVKEIDYGGTAVREYISSAGVVFAIAWNGIRHPDLTTLLGAYAGSYRQARQNAPRQPGMRHLSVKADGAVIEKWGHVRALQGRAYAPDLIPGGVTLDEIK